MGGYTKIVARLWWIPLILAPLLHAQQQDEKQAKPAPGQYQEPAEEDEALKPSTREYSFNPVQAEHEMKIGAYYFKKGNFRAAMRRFQEAGKWNPTLSDAYLKAAESAEKLRDLTAAKAAYEQYLAASPDGKSAPEVKKKLAALKN
jgi:tetratricopeptide (TPR) repeat protein